MECFHLPRGARTRWVTERIAPPPRVVGYDPESIRRNDRLECRLAKRTLGSSGLAQENLEFWERKLFYLLTPALMGDPFPRLADRGIISNPSQCRRVRGARR